MRREPEVRVPYWDTGKEKWIQVTNHRDSGGRVVISDHLEVANPVTGVFGQPPEGKSTRPKNR